MLFRSLMLLMGFIFVGVGCATSEATRTGKAYPPTDPRNIEVLFEKPERKYEVIGYISGEGPKVVSQEDVFESMKEEAAKLGADAILMRSDITEQNRGSNQYGAVIRKEGSALAIKWAR